MTLILCATKEKAELVESSLQALVGSEQQSYQDERKVEICLRTGSSIDKEKEVSVLIDKWIL
jgi:hypothetical protein